MWPGWETALTWGSTTRSPPGSDRLPWHRGVHTDLADASAIVVTGGAGGFGSAIVRRLAQMGAKVMIAEVSDERGEVLAIQSSSPLGPEKKPSTVVVMESVSFLNGVLLRPRAQ